MITVFIGTYNRLETLRRTVNSYKRFKTPHELVIVDNGTDDTDCLALLGDLEKEVKKVYSFPRVQDMYGATHNFLLAMDDQPKQEWFAVSEADVCFEGTSPKAQDMYVKLAEQTNEAAGCHLRVDKSIPSTYPLRSRVLSCESRMVYKHTMKWQGSIPYNSWQIDTTFHLFPAQRPFNRLHMNPWRVGPPYDAKHMDWHLNIYKPTRENKIYIQPSTAGVGSWGRQWLASYWNMFQEQGAEAAFEHLSNEPLDGHDDLCVNSFLLSWCHQYGVGTETNHEKSKLWLRNAIPKRFTDYWSEDREIFRHEQQMRRDWDRMIYENDFTCMGWV